MGSGVLLGSGVLGVLSACGSGGDTAGDTGDGGATATGSTRSGEPRFVVPTFADGFRSPPVIVAGIEQRLTFVVADELDILRRQAPATLELAVVRDDTTVTEGNVERHADGIVTPYYPVRFTPPEPGEYRAVVPGLDPVPFLVVDRSEVGLVQIGDPVRPVDTPTFDDARGVDPICTRPTPCPFHEITLTDAVADDRPVVLLISTPGFCQTDICGPVLELLVEEVGDRDDLAVVHAEVYVDPNTDFAEAGFPTTTPAVDAYALPFEPHLVVGGTDDTVVARLDTMWDRAELAEALAPVT